MLSVILAFLVLLPGAATQSTLRNPGFESSPPLEGWEVQARSRQENGRAPSIAVDREDAREGAQSLRIESLDPGDASVSQRVFLPVGTLWRARVWIKTANLVGTKEENAGGRMIIDTPGAEIASTADRSGTTPWQ
jgi:hypothetical protein